METAITILWQLFKLGTLTIAVLGVYLIIYAIIAGLYTTFTDKDL